MYVYCDHTRCFYSFKSEVISDLYCCWIIGIYQNHVSQKSASHLLPSVSREMFKYRDYNMNSAKDTRSLARRKFVYSVVVNGGHPFVKSFNQKAASYHHNRNHFRQFFVHFPWEKTAIFLTVQLGHCVEYALKSFPWKDGQKHEEGQCFTGVLGDRQRCFKNNFQCIMVSSNKILHKENWYVFGTRIRLVK